MLSTRLLPLPLLLSTSILAQTPSAEVADAPSPTFVSIAAGSAHFCAVDSDGDIHCWGDGRWGQLGSGSTESSDVVPVRIASFQRFRQVVAGATHTCALTTDGYAYCWGSDNGGVMGDASIRERCLGLACSTRPMPVAIGYRFDSLSAGFEHMCGLTHGRAYCWGRADAGQLGGVGTDLCDNVACSRRPVLVSDSLTFSSISARGTHTCGIAAAKLYCWGDNSYQQLRISPERRAAFRPVAVFSDISLTQVSSGGMHSCAVTTSGSVECWGTNDTGRLGAADAEATKATVALPAGDRATRVSVGGTHTCAVTSNAAAYCWGLNIDGRLGGITSQRCGQFDCSATPVRVVLDVPLADVAASAARTCALGRDGAVYCWGGPIDSMTVSEHDAPAHLSVTRVRYSP
jgi:alpha-tubulin suppressor-like RCC1 family protein